MEREPNDYLRPFCDWLSGNESEYKQNSDIVYQDNSITAFISPKWWVNNPGHVIIIPNKHVENLYDIPDGLLGKIYIVTKRVLLLCTKPMAAKALRRVNIMSPLAIKTYGIFILTYFPATKMTNYMKTITIKRLLILQNAALTQIHCERHLRIACNLMSYFSGVRGTIADHTCSAARTLSEHINNVVVFT